MFPGDVLHRLLRAGGVHMPRYAFKILTMSLAGATGVSWLAFFYGFVSVRKQICVPPSLACWHGVRNVRRKLFLAGATGVTICCLKSPAGATRVSSILCQSLDTYFETILSHMVALVITSDSLRSLASTGVSSTQRRRQDSGGWDGIDGCNAHASATLLFLVLHFHVFDCV